MASPTLSPSSLALAESSGGEKGHDRGEPMSNSFNASNGQLVPPQTDPSDEHSSVPAAGPDSSDRAPQPDLIASLPITGPLSASDPRTQVSVSNLPYRVRWQDLKDLFRRAGTVLRADVSLTSDHRSRGVGTVLLATEEDAKRAYDMFRGFNWQGRTLDVKIDRSGTLMGAGVDAVEQNDTMSTAAGSNQLDSGTMFTSPASLGAGSVSGPAVGGGGMGGVSMGLQPSLGGFGNGLPLHFAQPQGTMAIGQSPMMPATGYAALSAQATGSPVPGFAMNPSMTTGTFDRLMPTMGNGKPSTHSSPATRLHASPLAPLPQAPTGAMPYGSTTYVGRVLFVGNLPFHCQWQDLKDLFRTAGNIQRADVALNAEGKSRGFGTVLFASPEDAQNAVRIYHGYEYSGRTLKVHFDRFAQNFAPPSGALPASPSQYTSAFAAANTPTTVANAASFQSAPPGARSNLNSFGSFGGMGHHAMPSTLLGYRVSPAFAQYSGGLPPSQLGGGAALLAQRRPSDQIGSGRFLPSAAAAFNEQDGYGRPARSMQTGGVGSGASAFPSALLLPTTANGTHSSPYLGPLDGVQPSGRPDSLTFANTTATSSAFFSPRRSISQQGTQGDPTMEAHAQSRQASSQSSGLLAEPVSQARRGSSPGGLSDGQGTPRAHNAEITTNSTAAVPPSAASLPSKPPTTVAAAPGPHPGRIALPPQPFQPVHPVTMTPMSPYHGRVNVPMTPGMPGFSFHAVPETPPLLPHHLLSPGLGGPFSPPLPNPSFMGPMAPGAPAHQAADYGSTAPIGAGFAAPIGGGLGHDAQHNPMFPPIGMAYQPPQPTGAADVQSHRLPQTPHWSQPRPIKSRPAAAGTATLPGAPEGETEGDPVAFPLSSDATDGSTDTSTPDTEALARKIAQMSVDKVIRQQQQRERVGSSAAALPSPAAPSQTSRAGELNPFDRVVERTQPRRSLPSMDKPVIQRPVGTMASTTDASTLAALNGSAVDDEDSDGGTGTAAQ